MAKLGFLICENYYKEMKQAVDDIGAKNIIIKVYHANCARKSRIGANGFDKQITALSSECDTIHLFCSSGCVDIGSVKDKFPMVYIHEYKTCHEYLMDKPILEYYMKKGYYLITSGWLNNWEVYLKERWQLDENTAKVFFKESATKLLYIDSFMSERAEKMLCAMAEFVGLDYEVVPVSIQHLRSIVEKIVHKCNQEENRNTLKTKNKLIADYMMVIDIFNSLSKLSNEEQAIDDIFELINFLFGAEVVAFISITDGEITGCRSIPSDFDTEPYMEKLANSGDAYYRKTDSGKGFCVKIEFNDEVLGIIVIDHVLFEEYLEDNLNQFLNLRNLIGLTISNARNYSKLMQAQNNLHDLAYYDSLTGLMNRHAFLEAIKDNIIRAQADKSRFAVIFMDIDKFKQINDNYGHQYGDAALIEVGKTIKKSIRDNDKCARLGGDEFTIILNHIESAQHLEDIFGRIKVKLNRKMLILDIEMEVKASVGVAIYPEDGTTLEMLIKHSDEHMYRQKKENK